MRSQRRIHATWAGLLLVLGLGRWTSATLDPVQVAVEAAAQISNARAWAVERAAPAVVAIEARWPDRSETGSGILVDSEGFVLTALHVVDRAKSLEVRDADGRAYRARVYSKDASADLALLVLESEGRSFPTVRFARSADLRAGESVVAIGSPYGLTQTATAGILSARDRAGVVTDNAVPLLQTDASINPGCSGGALINLRGEVVGMINAILTRTGRSQGVGFAVPADEIVRVLPVLRARKVVRRPWIGVRVGTAPATDGGVEVQAVTRGGPAEHSGLRPGDRILSFNGQSVKNVNELRSLLRLLVVDAVFEIETARAGEVRTLRLTTSSRD